VYYTPITVTEYQVLPWAGMKSQSFRSMNGSEAFTCPPSDRWPGEAMARSGSEFSARNKFRHGSDSWKFQHLKNSLTKKTHSVRTFDDPFPVGVVEVRIFITLWSLCCRLSRTNQQDWPKSLVCKMRGPEQTTFLIIGTNAYPHPSSKHEDHLPHSSKTSISFADKERFPT
jgi:hypothetical protein